MTSYATFSFSLDDERAPQCCLSVASSGSMKVVRDSPNRERFFASLGIESDRVVSVTQTHSQTVHIAETTEDFLHLPEGDGILTVNPRLVPCVTVADCMPIWLYERRTGCFGVLHSGWKGTGIIGEALKCAETAWGARAQDFYVVFGPHIRDCCYTVDEERAAYFTALAGSSCLTLDRERKESGNQWPWRLSLSRANAELCTRAGIPSGHIRDSLECTSCNTKWGSHRRQGAPGFTQMAAFIRR